MSPTISSITSSSVTMPAWPPYSSSTIAIWKPSLRSSAISGSSRSESGTTTGLAIRCLTRVVPRSWTGTPTAFFTWTVPTTASCSSSTGKREWPVRRASSMTASARSPSSRLKVRIRGVMISPAVRVPNSTLRSMSSAASASRVPSSALRWISEASSVELRAERSSSCAFAVPLRTLIGSPLTAVNARRKPWVALAVPIGRARAMFFGTSSPNTIVRRVETTRPIVTAVGPTALSGRPSAVSGSRMSSDVVGSASQPMPRLVIVMPSCAPERLLDRRRNDFSTPCARPSPLAA